MSDRTGGNVSRADKRLAAVCGLFCPACHLYIATNEQPERLPVLAERYRFPAAELACDGCRSERRRSFFCREKCHMAACAAGRGIDFCGECAEYPCPELRAFQEQMPHRIELWQSLERIREAGYETWYAEMIGHFACPACGTINSAYDGACWKCGATPACDYVKLHGEAIRAW